MYCAKCGAQNPEGSNFCQSCGTALVATPSSSQTTQASPIVSPPPTQATPATYPSATTQPIKRTSGMAVAALVLGILGFFTGITSILAIIFGGVAMNETSKNPDISGRGMAVAGLVLGIIVLVGGIFFWIFWVIIIAAATGTA
jgi:hypothetical protein